MWNGVAGVRIAQDPLLWLGALLLAFLPGFGERSTRAMQENWLGYAVCMQKKLIFDKI